VEPLGDVFEAYVDLRRQSVPRLRRCASPCRSTAGSATFGSIGPRFRRIQRWGLPPRHRFSVQPRPGSLRLRDTWPSRTTPSDRGPVRSPSGGAAPSSSAPPGSGRSARSTAGSEADETSLGTGRLGTTQDSRRSPRNHHPVALSTTMWVQGLQAVPLRGQNRSPAGDSEKNRPHAPHSWSIQPTGDRVAMNPRQRVQV
jgi:hypothetical protein